MYPMIIYLDSKHKYQPQVAPKTDHSRYIYPYKNNCPKLPSKKQSRKSPTNIPVWNTAPITSMLTQRSFQSFDPRVTSEPRTVVLHRSRKGFGFVLRGAKSTTNLTEMTLSARYPALQYLDDVDEGGVADLAGLRKGDFLIRVRLYVYFGGVVDWSTVPMIYLFSLYRFTIGLYQTIILAL